MWTLSFMFVAPKSAPLSFIRLVPSLRHSVLKSGPRTTKRLLCPLTLLAPLDYFSSYTISDLGLALKLYYLSHVNLPIFCFGALPLRLKVL